MLRKLFTRNRSPRDLDQLIFDIAEYQRNEDYEEFYARIMSHRFYLSLLSPVDSSVPRGERIVVRADSGMRTRCAEIQGLKLVLFFTTATDARLGEHYAEIEGSEALRMALRSDHTDGALFQNNRSSWVGLDKQKISHVLSRWQTNETSSLT